jgi:hypothetical protein
MQETERGTMPTGKGDSSGRILMDDDLGNELWQPRGEKAAVFAFGSGVKDCVKLPACRGIVLVAVLRMLRAVPTRQGVGRSAIGLLRSPGVDSPQLLRIEEGVYLNVPPHFFGSGDASLAERNMEGLALGATALSCSSKSFAG